MLPKAILAFLFANRGQVKKVFNKRSRRNLLKSLAVIIVPVVSLYYFSPNTFNSLMNFSKDNIGQVIGVNVTTNPAIDNKKFNNPKLLNNKVLLGNIEWEVMNAEVTNDQAFVGINPDFCIPQLGNEFIKVTYKITNLDREILTVPKFNLNIYDNQKNEFPFSQKTYMCILQSTNPFSRYAPSFLKRGESKTYEILFEVPKDKKEFKMKVGDLSVFTGDYEYVILGI